MTASPSSKAARKGKGAPDTLDIQALVKATYVDLAADLHYSIFTDLTNEICVECITTVHDADGKAHTCSAWRRLGATQNDIVALMLQTGHEVYHAVDRIKGVLPAEDSLSA
jgi:hypothetical protein